MLYFDILIEQLPKLALAAFGLAGLFALVVRYFVLVRSSGGPSGQVLSWALYIVLTATMAGGVFAAARYSVKLVEPQQKHDRESAPSVNVPRERDRPDSSDDQKVEPIANLSKLGDIPLAFQSDSRGTINAIDAETETFSVVWEDSGRAKMRAASSLTNFAQLKAGQIVNVVWYDYVDFMIAKQTPETEAQAKSLVARGARLAGVTGTVEVRLWSMSGMVAKIDGDTIFLINASSGRSGDSPDGGEVIQLPRVRTAAGKAALATLRPGNKVVTVWSQQTAIKAAVLH